MRLILDASTALAAVLPDEDSGFARAAVAAALRDGLVVPTLWLYEIQSRITLNSWSGRWESNPRLLLGR